jgi:hypothetical protein
MSIKSLNLLLKTERSIGSGILKHIRKTSLPKDKEKMGIKSL